jgi:hypothetical protein
VTTRDRREPITHLTDLEKMRTHDSRRASSGPNAHRTPGKKARVMKRVVESVWAQMSCAEVLGIRPLLARCELRSPEQDRALFHLASCPACRRELAEYVNISNAIKSHRAALPGLPPSAWSNLRETMETSRHLEEVSHTPDRHDLGQVIVARAPSGHTVTGDQVSEHEHTDPVLVNRFLDAVTAALLLGGVPPVLAGVCRGTLGLAISTETV